MTDISNPDVEEQPVPGPGMLLRMAREARGITVSEVAAALKMSPRQIESIEGEDFSRLSGATFIRGFIRNYAKLLKIDVGPLLAALEEKTELPVVVLNAPADAGVKMPNAGGRNGNSPIVPTFLALILLGVAFSLYFELIDFDFLFGKRDLINAPSSPRAEQTQVIQPIHQPVIVSQPSELSELPVVLSKQGAPSENSNRVAGVNQLVFSFDGNSWVEVKDASGRTVFSQMNSKGTTQVVEGRTPFQLVVGNASHVRLQYNDQPVDLRPHTRVEVARLTLE